MKKSILITICLTTALLFTSCGGNTTSGTAANGSNNSGSIATQTEESAETVEVNLNTSFTYAGREHEHLYLDGNTIINACYLDDNFETIITTSYNEQGKMQKVVEEQQGMNYVRHYGYDDQGRIVEYSLLVGIAIDDEIPSYSGTLTKIEYDGDQVSACHDVDISSIDGEEIEEYETTEWTLETDASGQIISRSNDAYLYQYTYNADGFIKSIDSYRLTDGEEILSSSSVFDETGKYFFDAGNTVQFTTYDVDGTVLNTTDYSTNLAHHFHMENGKIVPEENEAVTVIASKGISYDPSDRPETKYFYDEAGRMLLEMNYHTSDYQGLLWGFDYNVYDESGKLIAKRDVNRYSDFVYDEADHLIRETGLSAYGEPLEQYCYEYDDNGDMIKKWSYGLESGICGYIFLYEYDTEHHVTETTCYQLMNWNGSEPDLNSLSPWSNESFTYEMDANGNVISCESYMSIVGGDPSKHDSHLKTYTYDSKNRLVEEEHKLINGHVYEKILYEYLDE